MQTLLKKIGEIQKNKLLNKQKVADEVKILMFSMFWDCGAKK